MSGIYRVIGRERSRLRVSMALMTVGCPCCRVHGWSGVRGVHGADDDMGYAGHATDAWAQ